ncbi:Uncharacterised protein [Escherichia coli]|uniref:Uncharacterized protein n=1 Tax=Escherichia coli TaxID=562 RepID=A0A376U565_ECOLX|nr:Uncharacterised protein [Escherichia coli]
MSSGTRWRRFPSDCRMGNIHASVVVVGRENARNEAQASALKSTADTLNIISAGVQDMQQVLAQLPRGKSATQSGRRGKDVNSYATILQKMNAPTLCLTLVY